jgi:hypothetical protein
MSDRSILSLTALALALGIALAAPVAFAQSDEPRFDMDELKRQLDQAWEEMMRELGPAIEGFGALLETLDRVDSLEHYERPEILPNGDIVIRRRPDAPPLPAPEPEPAEPEAAPAPGPGIRT